MKKAFIVKTGRCYPHKTDYNLLKSCLITNGWQVTESAQQADLLIINTCALTKEHEDEAIRYVQKALEQKKRDARMVVTGCLPRINQKRLWQIFKGDVISADSIEKIDPLIGDRASIKDIAYIGEPVKPKNIASREYLLRIGWGCDGKCIYCGVKRVFGKPRSRPLQDIMKEYELAYRKGYACFTLVANDSGSYGNDRGNSLIYLLFKLCEKYKNTRFKLSHMLPNTLQNLIPSMSQFIKTDRITHINIPAESGSDRILGLMQRGYTVDDFKDCIRQLFSYNPNLHIKTDIMVGFPSETELDFLASLRLVEWLGRRNVYFQCLAYSARPFTRAGLMPQIASRIKNRRLRQVKKLCLLSYNIKDEKSFKKLDREIITV